MGEGLLLGGHPARSSGGLLAGSGPRLERVEPSAHQEIAADAAGT